MNVYARMELVRPAPEVIAKVVAELTRDFGNRCVTSKAVREQHANTLTWTENQPPDAVVYPMTTEEVVQIVKLCALHKVPIIAFGIGSSFEGHVNAPIGGVSVDTSMMKAIKEVHAEDLDCVIEPGVTRKQLNEYLRDQGLFFPIDPGADASLGGMTATRASGTNAVRYGTMKDNVIALKAVLANGDVITTARRAKKTSAGYDLTRLFVGSEGTLGIITEITLKLQGIPEAISAAVCSFPSVKDACDTAIMTIQSGIPIARVELLDAVAIRATNLYSKLDLPEKPMLLVEFHGSDSSVKEQAERFGEIAAGFGSSNFQWTTKPEERTRLWQARHDSYWASMALRPGAKGISTDVCVPISRLAECVDESIRDLETTGLIGPIVGHVGDGNFHVLPLIDMDDPGEIEKGKAYVGRLVERALAMGGTCTGEHGVGQGKMKYLEKELGPENLAAMRLIKRAFDPENIMNPGKIVAL
ncbi:MAG: FAD-binding protein [Methylocystis sp.]|nr:FAD-binding protein [Methylocystis sp.]MCA3583383.1 FAD-binding protein [Methylocystis sp.]MCA3589763.1 FAD-binding protein [Methylocystis sp.]MCA3591902.1 FAD-binding protein [Methylocystis sp.]